ncbi:MAG: serine/threonine protein kinase [Acidobacteriia bacterium]|nr:serine/threonine protein kinase [Terriglobia bacterium]
MNNERYEILETIGTGASGRVVKARDTLIGRTVALKTLLCEFGTKDSSEKFLNEARIVGQLNDSSIVGLFDVGIEEHGQPYLVMEYVPGSTLAKVMEKEPVPLQRACLWAAHLARALGRAHAAGIIHGDVKPANILVNDDGQIKLGDFGIARFITQLSYSGSIAGTPAYLSPEQIEGKKQDARSDIFSLGVLLYEMTTGERPFEGTSLAAVCAQILAARPLAPARLNPAIPAEVERIILRCLAKDPADRYATADKLAAELYPIARRGPQAPSRMRRLWNSQPALRAAAWAGGTLALLALAAIPAVNNVRRRMVIPPAPVFVSAAPQPPQDLYGRPERVAALNLAIADARAASPASASKLPPGPAYERSLSVEKAQAAVAAPRNGAAELPAAKQKLASVDIEISGSAVETEETLVVFADRDMLYSAMISPNIPRKAVHLRRQLPPGSHQLRVALYHADKSLHLEQEGLAEIAAGRKNHLRIQITRHSKFMHKADPVLQVTWPAAPHASDASTHNGAVHSAMR